MISELLFALSCNSELIRVDRRIWLCRGHSRSSPAYRPTRTYVQQNRSPLGVCLFSPGAIMSITTSSRAFGYDAFFFDYLSVPLNKALMERSSAPLPHPSTFSSTRPRDCCLAALHGHQIYPPDDQSIKERVKDGGAYFRTVLTRIRRVTEMVENFNARQKQVSEFIGGRITITMDDGPLVGSFPLEDFGGEDIVRAAPQFELDRKFLTLGHSGRLNHFAQEYGFANVEQLRAFIRMLDAEALALGFPSYAAICVPSRYLEHLQNELANDEGMQSLLATLTENLTLLQQQSAFTLERFVTCRRSSEKHDFFVDVSEYGVYITILDGPLEGRGLVSSTRMSDRSKDFQEVWFE